MAHEQSMLPEKNDTWVNISHASKTPPQAAPVRAAFPEAHTLEHSE
jgi:hypothetical protein